MPPAKTNSQREKQSVVRKEECQEKSSPIWNLPNELLAEIWKRCAANDRRNSRCVCRRWRNLHDSLNFKRARFLWLNISVRNNHYALFGRREGSGSRSIEVPLNENDVRNTLKLAELAWDSTERTTTKGGTLSIEGCAIKDSLLAAVADQRWNIRVLELRGETVFLGPDALCTFIKRQNEMNGRVNIDTFSIQNGVINVGFISDRLFSAFNGALTTFSVQLDPLCRQWLSRTSISNYSLPTIFRPNLSCRLPAPLASRVTLKGLVQALKEFFATDWEQKGASASTWRDKMGTACTEPGFYSCSVSLHTNSTISAKSLADIELPNVEKSFFRPYVGRLEYLEIGKSEVTDKAKIVFTKKQGDRSVIASVVIF